MHHHNPDSAHLNQCQSKLLLAQTHRVIQCDSNVDVSTNKNINKGTAVDPQLTGYQTNNTQTGRWQRLLQLLKKITAPGLFAISTLLVPQTQAREVSISVQGQIQPGVYGQIHVGPPAVSVYQQPVYVQPQTVYLQPILVQAPKKHRKHWKKYCHHYGACQQRVQFVEVDYRPRHYEKVYVYQERDRGRREEKRHYHSNRH